jgi:uncharacterized protein YraI
MRGHRFFALTVILIALGVLTWAMPVQAQTAVWTGEYYNNGFLAGTPAVTQTSGAVSFDWGDSAPLAGVNADNFSVRWTTRVNLPSGRYRFFVQADDAVSVQVNFQTIIDTFGGGQVGQVVSNDVQLPNGVHQIQVNYREATGNAFVFVSFANAANNPTAPNFSPAQQPVTTAVEVTGWTAQYYGNNALSGLPTAILSETDIDFDWGDGSPFPSVPVDNFSARWTTTTTLDAGTYRFTTRSDDGMRVFVNGQTLIDRWDGPIEEIVSNDIELTAGQHNIAVEYHEDVGNAYVTLDVSRVTLNTVDAVVPTPSTVNPVVQPGVPTNTGALGTVAAPRLNVRNAPTTDSRILVKIEEGQTYPIVGRNADSSWWQIDVNGTVGWVFAPFIIDQNIGLVPVTSSASQSANIPGTGFFVTATATVNLRSGPTRSSAILGQLPRGARAEITGRNTTGSWIQVNYNGTLSWVSSAFVVSDVATSDIPLATE